MTLPRIKTADGEIPYSSATLTRSLEQITSSVRWQSHEFRPDLINRPVELAQGDQTLFSGYLEHITGDSYGGFTYAGRSLTSALLVNDADGNELFRKTSVLAILRTLCNRVGIDLESAPADKVSKFRLEKGENLAGALRRLAETYRLIVTDTKAGALRGYRAPDSADINWKSGAGTVTSAVSLDLDFSDWRNTWVCRGQRELVSDDLPDSVPGQIGVELSTGAIRSSIRVLPNKSAVNRADARRYVEWEAKRALARAVRLTVKHSEWPGDVGQRVRLEAPSLGVKEDLIISTLALDISSSSYQVTTELVLPDVYSSRPLRPRIERRVSTFKVAQGPVEVVR